MTATFRLANFWQLLHFYHKGGYQNLTERITHLKNAEGGMSKETLGMIVLIS